MPHGAKTQQPFPCPSPHHPSAGAVRHVAVAGHPVLHPARHRPGCREKGADECDPTRDSRAENARTAQSAASGQRSETASVPDVPTAEQKRAKQWHKTLTTLCTIFGAIFLLVGIGDLADAMEELWSHEIDWDELLTALAQTIGGGAASSPACGWTAPASWNASSTRSSATGTTSRWASCSRRSHRRGPRPHCGGTRHRPRLFRGRCLH